MRVAVLGLGEAGSLLAADLVEVGDEVGGYDPAATPDVEGVRRHRTATEAVAGCELVLAVTPASVSHQLLEEVAGTLDGDTVYADLSTGAPAAKRRLAEAAAGAGVAFADVALMAPVPGRGLAVPSLASGTGAVRYAEALTARGGEVEVVGDEAGAAAARKLLRSVVTKGLAALVGESHEAATRHGQAEWFWGHLVDQLGSIDEALLLRFLHGTGPHAERRLAEMEAARDMLVELGVEPTMTRAVVERLRRVADRG